MAKLRSKLGVSILLLIATVIFGYAGISGVLGSSQIGLTLFTNPNLERGLIAHFTFDGLSVDQSAGSIFDLENFDDRNQYSPSEPTSVAAMQFNSDGTKMYVLDGFETLYQYSLSPAYDITTATYDSVSFSASGQVSSGVTVTFSATGSLMYILDSSDDDVHQYSLSTNFDISSASYDSRVLDATSQDETSNGFWISTDGSKAYVLGASTTMMYEYDLSTDFDLSTATYNSGSTTIESGNLPEIQFETAKYEGLWFNESGTIAYTSSSFFDGVERIDFATPWDISTAATGTGYYESTETSDDISPSIFSRDGYRAYDFSSRTITQYVISDAFDVQTLELDTLGIAQASVVSSGFAGNELIEGLGAFVGATGTKLYIVDGPGTVLQYSFGTAYDINTISYEDKSFDISAQGEGPTGIALSATGTKMFVFGQDANVYQYTLATPWDVSTASYDSVSFDTSSQVLFGFSMSFHPDGTSMYIEDVGNEEIFQYTLGTAWDLTTASYASKSLSVSSSSGGASEGLVFNGDGTKLFGVSESAYEYTLSVAYDVSTGSYSGESVTLASLSQTLGASFNADGTELYVFGNGTAETVTFITAYDLTTASSDQTNDLIDGYRVFDEDGTGSFFLNSMVDGIFDSVGERMYMLGTNATSVYQYTSNPPFDIDQATYDNKSLVVSAQDDNPVSIAISTDGTKLYMLGDASNDVFEYDLSTPYDISTATYNSVSFAADSQETGPTLLRFSSDGLKMFISGGNERVYQYSLSPAWDLSSASYDSINLNFADVAIGGTTFAFNPDGTKVYAGGEGTLRQHSLSTPWNVSTATTDDTYKLFGFLTENSVLFDNSGSTLFLLADGNAFREYTSEFTDGISNRSSGESLSYSGNVLQNTGGVMGQGISFSGVSETLYDNAVYGTSSTFAMWFRPDSLATTSGDQILGTLDRSAYVAISSTTGQIEAFGFPSATIYVNGGTDYTPTGSWQHVAVTDTTGVYTHALEIGGMQGSYFSGLVDDVRLYDRVLSQNEIQRMYELGATTEINKTLNNNPDLERDLVGHWTFDAKDINGFNVTDRAGTNEGFIYATSSRASDEVVDSSINSTDTRNFSTSPHMVWINDDEGFIFYNDFGADITVASTSDGGTSWGNFQMFDKTSGYDVRKIAVWYDQWTPGDTGNLIHIAYYSQIIDEEIFYTTYNTLTDELSASATTTNTSANYSGLNYLSITKGIDGAVYVTANDSSDEATARCAADCTNESNWSLIDGLYNNSGGNDHPIMFPIKGTDNILAVYNDNTDQDLEFNVFSATSSSWWGANTIATGLGVSVYYGETMGGALHKQTGKVYVVSVNDDDDFVTQDHDIHLWEFEPSTYAWTQLTNPLTNTSGGLVSSKIAVDENNGDLYVVYGRRTTIGTETTVNIYYQLSTDGGNTWSGEQGPLNDTTEDLSGITVNQNADETIWVRWQDETADDLYAVEVADIGDYSNEKQSKGKIGQGFEFDGIDDTIYIGNSLNSGELTTTHTAAFWSKGNGGTAVFGKTNGASHRIGFNGPTTMRYGHSGDTADAACLCDADEWNHYVYVRTDTNVDFYVNGVFVGSDTLSTNVDFDTNQIGARSTQQYHDGVLDDARLYTRALSPDEILRLYQLGATTKINTTIRTNPDLERGLVEHLTFDGKYMDISNSSAEIIATDGSTFNWINNDGDLRFGTVGQAIGFDGSTSYAERGIAEASAAPLTMCAWVYVETLPSSIPEDMTAVAINDNSNSDSFNLRLGSDDTFQFTVRAASDTASGAVSTTTIALKKWYHMCGVEETSTLRHIYVNGVYEDSDTGSHVPTVDTTRVGGFVESSQFDYFDGYIDDVRIYDRVLSAEEITRLYELGD